MEKVIVFTRADGGVTVRYPVLSERRHDETNNAFYQRLAAEALEERIESGTLKILPPKAVSVPIIIDKKTLPKDRSTRSDWKIKGNKVVVERKPVEEGEPVEER